jgi:hypothetical protein
MATTTNSSTTEKNADQPSPDRITIALIPKVAAELQRLQNRTDLSKTDLVNRAITLYEFIDEQMREGRDLVIRDGKTGEAERIRFW